jgi:hypothetical protein
MNMTCEQLSIVMMCSPVAVKPSEAHKRRRTIPMTARSMGLLRMPQLFEPEEAARSGNDEKAVAITVSPYRSGFLDGREAGKKNIPLERGKDHIG